MSFHAKQCVGGLAIVLLALAVSAGSSRTDSISFGTSQDVSIGQTQLPPGNYTLRATESQNQLEILKDKKIIATVPCTWFKLPQKAADSEVVQDSNRRVVRVEFQGRTEAVKVE
jgi:hypothetical protein